MKTVLILCDQQQRVEAQLSLVGAIKKRFKVAVIFSYDISHASIERFREQSCECYEVDRTRNRNINSMAPSNFSIAKTKIIKTGEKSSLVLLFSAFACFLMLINRYRKIFPIVWNIAPSIVLVNGDRGALGDEQVLLKIAKKLGIPSMMPYFCHISDGIAIRKKKRRYYINSRDPLAKRIIYEKYRYQSLQVEDGTMYFYLPEVMLGLGFFGTLSTNPWMIGNGLLDIVCVDNQRNKQACIEGGVEENKLKVVGDIQYDDLFDAYRDRELKRKRLLDRYGMDYEKHTIILAMPQLAEHHIMDWDTHWKEVRFLVDSLIRNDRNLLISLHPKADHFKYRFLEKIGVCMVLEEPLKEVLPVADLFVATFSSTVLWAVLCGVNAVVVDFYAFNYNVFDYLDSISIIRDKEKFEESIANKLLESVDFEGDWRELSRQVVFDGKTLERYGALIEEVARG